MPPFEDIAVKILPNIVTEVTDSNKPSFNGIENEEDLVEKASTLHLQESKAATPRGSIGDFVVEPRSGFKFPLHLSPVGYTEGFTQESSQQVLVGVGIRSVLSLLKIYAFGFYLKPECMRGELGSKYGGVPPQELKLKPSFYEDLLRHELDMSMRLIVHHKRVRIGLVKSTFETALRNRLKKMKSEDVEGVRAFTLYFTDDLALPAGTVIDFHWQPGGKFHTKVGDRFMGTISSLDFCRAFFDMYIGDLPVCWRAKQEIGFKLGQMLSESSSSTC